LTQWIDRYREEFCLSPPSGFDLSLLEALWVADGLGRVSD
jgi:hypothetical protein